MNALHILTAYNIDVIYKVQMCTLFPGVISAQMKSGTSLSFGGWSAPPLIAPNIHPSVHLPICLTIRTPISVTVFVRRSKSTQFILTRSWLHTSRFRKTCFATSTSNYTITALKAKLRPMLQTWARCQISCQIQLREISCSYISFIIWDSFVFQQSIEVYFLSDVLSFRDTNRWCFKCDWIG